MLPSELNTCIEAFSDRRRYESRVTEANIYSLACLIRAAVWAKSMPKFDKAFPDEAPKETPDKKTATSMSDEAMFAQVVQLNAMFGGTVT